MAERNVRSEVSSADNGYELQMPTLATARAALTGFYGPHAEDIWRTLLFSAGLTGEETDRTAFGRLISAMQVAEPMTRLCARGLAVRAAAYERLVAPMKGTG
ncbi:hypothetical protein Acy02nite_34220 [Actinoplanes cyaneus]|uniref:Uncharacterized protein n=2 Tax=Actinoplanes cyaneus TaxID=52696 RepID=A0A919MBX3_9ACTN|nr:hypothetical protein [Actinoplanes cyaneus]GID65541.1 hypothetical protein Acy02nite_34220 [Actinoplanes cyaneus]